ncbi:hypothetical protein [Christiangramia sp. SM2212]|uniref:Lipoprotein n=1 Tax=Christiangramia sediminicola TaxID=3073267 RepID=A0ABU1EL85_9FLAO|nr:hypothetical protein [Christiangramia sp. SM2212]MDR5589094.1 hypothetical protein [Christiangramia sp. SM2212]
MKSKIILAITVLCLTSCGLKPIPTEHDLIIIENNDIKLSDLGNGKVLIYNDANILHTSDNTSRLNIKLDDKNLGQLRAKNYAVIMLTEGEHNFNIRHLDVVNMKSDHKVNVTDSVKVIRVKPTITSNKLEIVNQLPDNWTKYEYMNSK